MLPKLSYPTYDVKLPSTGKTVTIRPFLVKEEKMLLIALESEEPEDIISTTKQVINNCIVSGDVDIDKLPFFDVDYLFIALRAKSVGESIDIKFTCNKLDETGNPCGATFDAKIDISNVGLRKKENVDPNVVLSSSMSVKMKYPSYKTMKTLTDELDDMTKKIQMIASCIDMIVDGEQVHTTKDVTKEEMIDFVENLTQQQFRKMEVFIENLPSFYITTEAKCKKCGYLHKLEYDDFTSFFV